MRKLPVLLPSFKGVTRSFGILSYRREALCVLSGAALLITILSLVSFSSQDNCFFYYASFRHASQNWCGVVGAHWASLLFYFVGYGAFVVVSLFFVPLFFLLFQIPLKQQWDRLLALGGLMGAAPVFCAAHALDFVGGNPGGMAGSFIWGILCVLFNRAGAFILLYGTLLMSVIALARLSLADFFLKVCVPALVVAWHAVLWLIRFAVQVLRGIFFSARSTISFLGSCIASRKNAWKNADESFEKNDAEWLEEAVKCFPQNSDQTNREYTSATGKVSPEYYWQDDIDFASSTEVEDYFFQQEPTNKTGKFFWDKQAHSKPRLAGRFRGKTFFYLPNSLFARNIFLTANEELGLFLQTGKPSGIDDYRDDKKNERVIISYSLPDPRMLSSISHRTGPSKIFEEELQQRAQKLEEKLSHFGVKGTITAVRPGPVITLFEYTPQIDTKISKIIALEDDLALALQAMSIRIIAPIPGRSVIGFEIANPSQEIVHLADILQSDYFEKGEASLPIVLGVDSVGTPVVEDLSAMPHLLVAGSTGSGKSVGLNAMLMSLLCKLTPTRLRLILIDPKRLEFASYEDIPHLLFPIVANPRKVTPVLQWLVREMEKRYEKMARTGVRSFIDYQELILSKSSDPSDEDEDFLPFIVVIIDELADLMMVAGKEVEIHITRLAQMARAAGIHLIVATQRPSVDVLTGLIKVNFPSRIAYRVSSKIDSKTILDTSGAEKLLGRGDMLCRRPRYLGLQRIHGPYVSDKEIATLASYIRGQQSATYLDINEIIQKEKDGKEIYEDELYDDVLSYLKTVDEVSISMIQRKYRIGFNRSARIIERLEMDGMIAPAQGSKPRKVLHD